MAFLLMHVRGCSLFSFWQSLQTTLPAGEACVIKSKDAMKNKILKVFACVIAVIINYWLIYTYFPLIWKSLHPLFLILILAMVIAILGIGTGVVTAIESGFSGEIIKSKQSKKSSAITYIDWIILFPLKLFVFTFLLYLVSSYYFDLYSRIYHNPELLKNTSLKSLPLIFAPVFGLLVAIVCGTIWTVKSLSKDKAV